MGGDAICYATCHGLREHESVWGLTLRRYALTLSQMWPVLVLVCVKCVCVWPLSCKCTTLQSRRVLSGEFTGIHLITEIPLFPFLEKYEPGYFSGLAMATKHHHRAELFLKDKCEPVRVPYVTRMLSLSFYFDFIFHCFDWNPRRSDRTVKETERRVNSRARNRAA